MGFEVLIGSLLLAGLLIWLCLYVPYTMAVNRDRSPGLWIAISILCSPLLSILLLAALGPDQNKRDNRVR